MALKNAQAIMEMMRQQSGQGGQVPGQMPPSMPPPGPGQLSPTQPPVQPSVNALLARGNQETSPGQPLTAGDLMPSDRRQGIVDEFGGSPREPSMPEPPKIGKDPKFTHSKYYSPKGTDKKYIIKLGDDGQFYVEDKVFKTDKEATDYLDQVADYRRLDDGGMEIYN